MKNLTLIFVILLSSSRSFATETLIIQLKKPPTAGDVLALKKQYQLKSLTLFDTFQNDYFKRTYRAETDGSSAMLALQIIHDSRIERAEKVFEVQSLSIKPATESKALTKDPFSIYQWALLNQNQTLYRDIDDIHSEKLIGKPGTDTGYSKVIDKLPALMKRDVIVAVVDSGVSLDHADLKPNIYRNMAECQPDGSLRFQPKEDLDGNGYIGDCMGWNFVTKGASGDEKPYDDLGHGTHVSGIIAAKQDNEIGISGFSDRIKILPVKVLQKSEGGNNSAVGLSMTDRLAKGILYATKMNVDVINLSLGWPNSVETTYLREAVKAAIQKGIIVVAAAGNNSNDNITYPCAYNGVVCVGSVANDGSISLFSNYGGSVDVLAPGEQILSTIPTKLQPELFSVQGYDLKNGTSQSAPHVSAMAAILKSIFTEESSTSIISRMIESASDAPLDLDRSKFFRKGLVKLDQAIAIQKTESISPSFKQLSSILFKKQNLAFSFSLPIQNAWKGAAGVQIEIASSNPDIEIDVSRFEIGTLLENQTIALNITGKLKSILTESSTFLEVKVKSEAQTQKIFRNRIFFSRDLNGDPDITTYKILSATPVTDLFTVSSSYQNEGAPSYYRTMTSADGIFTVEIFQNSGTAYDSKSNLLKFKNVTRLLSVASRDFNFDGNSDYQLTFLKTEDTKKYLEYCYYTRDLRPLFASTSCFRFEPTQVVVNLQTVRYTYKEVVNVGKVPVPVFTEIGATPSADQDPSPWKDKDTSQLKRIYYLDPVLENGSFSLKTRILDNLAFIKKFKSDRSLTWDEDVLVINSLAQTEAEAKVGKVSILVSYGKTFSRKTEVLTLIDSEFKKMEFLPIQTPNAQLEGTISAPVIDLSSEKNQFYSGDSMVGYYSNTRLLNTFIQNQSIQSVTSYEHPFPSDFILGAIAFFKTTDGLVSFYQSKSNLIAQFVGANQKLSSFLRPIVRFSFLPGKIFNESFYPIITDSIKPSLYVDGTQISADHVYTMVFDHFQLTAPAVYNVKIESNCRALNPVRFSQSESFSYAFYCSDKSGQYLKYLKLVP